MKIKNKTTKCFTIIPPSLTTSTTKYIKLRNYNLNNIYIFLIIILINLIMIEPIKSMENQINLTPLASMPVQPYYIFQQTINHLSYDTIGTFEQRFSVNKKFVPINGKPKAVFFLVSGEGPLSSEIVNHNPFVQIANETQALIVALELRYYGESMPFLNMNNSNMAYLTTDQILEDLATFQVFFTNKYQLNDIKWIIMGCSYAGTISAWYRLKYPHLVTAAIASSSPFRAELRFTEYDVKVRQNLGAPCSKAFKNLFSYIEHLMIKNNSYVKSKFTCERQLDDRMFLYLLSEALTYSVQYDARFKIISGFCPKFVKLTNSSEALLDMFSSYVKNMFLFQNVSCDAYNLYEFASNEIDYSGTRSWTWQLCREYGWFMVPSGPDSFKPQSLGECWWQNDVCKTLYGRAMRPTVDRINMVYGSTNFKYISNVLFTNCGNDPWSTLSIDPSVSLPFSQQIHIPGESHCANWLSEQPSDSIELKNARALANSFLRQFIKPDCDENDCSTKNGLCIAKKLTDLQATSVCISNGKIQISNQLKNQLNIMKENGTTSTTATTTTSNNGNPSTTSNSNNNNNNSLNNENNLSSHAGNSMDVDEDDQREVCSSNGSMSSSSPSKNSLYFTNTLALTTTLSFISILSTLILIL
ncbi:hypothetical protein ACTFIW_006113 [Dictyostelium discoideum]